MSATASKPRPSSATKAASPAAKPGGVAKDAPRTQQVGFETASSGDDRLQFVSQALIGYKADVEVRRARGHHNCIMLALSCYLLTLDGVWHPLILLLSHWRLHGGTGERWLGV